MKKPFILHDREHIPDWQPAQAEHLYKCRICGILRHANQIFKEYEDNQEALDPYKDW